MTGIDPWFLDQMQQIVDVEKEMVGPARSCDSFPALGRGRSLRGAGSMADP